MIHEVLKNQEWANLRSYVPPSFDLQHVEEAYTTEHWIVRIYKVKKLSNRLQAKDALR